MESIGHSTLLKYFVEISNTMSEQSPTIESDVPGLQQLRSVTETTLEKPEWDNTGNNSNNVVVQSKYTKESATEDGEMYLKTPTDTKNTEDNAKSSDTEDKANFNSEKVPSVIISASEENAVAGKAHFVYSPVITMTKEESTLTKGDLKLQKVVVTEDISDESAIKNGALRVEEACSPPGVHTEIRSEVLAVPLRTDQNSCEHNDKHKTNDADQKDSKKIQTKIPKLRLKQVVERIRREKPKNLNAKDLEPSSEQKRRSSIPRLKDFKNTPLDVQGNIIPNKQDQELESPKVDDEFNKIYEEIIESEASNKVPSPEKISNPIKLESKFEEIIHAYDDNNVQLMDTEKTKSKIPLLKRKSEQEIEMPPTYQPSHISHRKYSFKKSNTEGYKNETPVTISIEKSLKSDIDPVKHDKSSTPQTNKINSEDTKVIPKNKTGSLDNVNTTVYKTIKTQKSIDPKEFNNSSFTGNLKKAEYTSSDSEKDTTKRKIPVALNARECFDMEIKSATLNKHPTRINVNAKISRTNHQQDIIRGENVKKSHSRSGINESSTVLIEKEHPVKQDDEHSNLETNNNIHKKLAKKEIISLENLSSPQSSDMKIMNANKPEASDLTNNVKSPPDQNKMMYVLPSQNEIENNNIDNNTMEVKKDKENPTTKEPKASNIPQLKNANEHNQLYDKDPKYFTQDDKISNESKEFKKDNEKGQTLHKIELTLESPIRAIINENYTITETNSNTQIITTPQIVSENGTLIRQNRLEDKPTNTCDIKAMPVKEPLVSKNTEELLTDKDQIDLVTKKVANVQTVLETENLGGNTYKLEDLPSNIEDKPEEDIIMLKGKVNRVIRRLDSKDNKTVMKELDDIPKEVSVISKIAIFERSESKGALSKSSEDIGSREQDVINDKPEIVNEVLKTDINQNELNSAEESINTAASENTPSDNRAIIRNDLEIKKDSSKTQKTNESKTKNILYEGKKINRTISSGVNNEVFGKDDEKSSLEVWNEYRRRKVLRHKEDSDTRRAKSLAELDLGDAVRGRVQQLVARMGSVDRGERGERGEREERGERWELGERAGGGGRPRGGAVSERIAMYEKKLTQVRSDAPPARLAPASVTDRQTEANSIDEEQLRRKIEELNCVPAKYGRLQGTGCIELADGGRMPVLALGTAMLEPALVRHVIHAGIELGYRAFDCAYIYGNEREVGLAIRDKIQDGTVTRSELFIINKLWSTSHRRDLVLSACRRSLEAMGLDYFDLYLIHNPMSLQEGPNPLPKIAGVLQYSTHDYLEAWFGIEGLISQGLVRRGGLSNFNSQQVDRVVEKARIKPVINQVECHPYLNQLRLEEFCLSRNIKLSCFGVLGSKGTPTELTSGLAPAIDDPLVKVMAAGLGVTPAQLLISYQLRLGRSVVVKCSSAPHLAQARAMAPPSPAPETSDAQRLLCIKGGASVAPVTLDASHVAALNALNRNKRMFTFKGMGDTHKNYPFRIPF